MTLYMPLLLSDIVVSRLSWSAAHSSTDSAGIWHLVALRATTSVVYTVVLAYVYTVMSLKKFPDYCFQSSSLRLLLGAEAPVVTPTGVDFSFFLYCCVGG